jgi:hypothetical protein
MNYIFQNNHLASQKILLLLWNLKVHYHSQQYGLYPGQMNPVRILTPYFFKIHFNIILPSMP